jgi:hypothetical protein
MMLPINAGPLFSDVQNRPKFSARNVCKFWGLLFWIHLSSDLIDSELKTDTPSLRFWAATYSRGVVRRQHRKWPAMLIGFRSLIASEGGTVTPSPKTFGCTRRGSDYTHVFPRRNHQGVGPKDRWSFQCGSVLQVMYWPWGRPLFFRRVVMPLHF